MNQSGNPVRIHTAPAHSLGSRAIVGLFVCACPNSAATDDGLQCMKMLTFHKRIVSCLQTNLQFLSCVGLFPIRHSCVCILLQMSMVDFKKGVKERGLVCFCCVVGACMSSTNLTFLTPNPHPFFLIVHISGFQLIPGNPAGVM